MESIKKAVCALIVDPIGKVLTVSRKDNPNDIGLPGGKVDTDNSGLPIETEIEAVKREVLEETGYTVNVLKPIYTDITHGYTVTTFLCEIDTSISYKALSEKETGVVSFQPYTLLLTNSTFKDYNKKLLEISKSILSNK